MNGGGGQLAIQGRVLGHTYIGDYFETEIETPSGTLKVLTPSDIKPPAAGEECVVSALGESVSFIS